MLDFINKDILDVGIIISGAAVLGRVAYVVVSIFSGKEKAEKELAKALADRATTLEKQMLEMKDVDQDQQHQLIALRSENSRLQRVSEKLEQTIAEQMRIIENRNPLLEETLQELSVKIAEITACHNEHFHDSIGTNEANKEEQTA